MVLYSDYTACKMPLFPMPGSDFYVSIVAFFLFPVRPWMGDLNLLPIYGGVCVLPTGSDVYLYCIYIAYIYILQGIRGWPWSLLCLGYVALFFGQRCPWASKSAYVFLQFHDFSQKAPFRTGLMYSHLGLLPRDFRHLIRAVAPWKRGTQCHGRCGRRGNWVDMHCTSHGGFLLGTPSHKTWRFSIGSIHDLGSHKMVVHLCNIIRGWDEMMVQLPPI